jgi:hypothetical protein
MEDRKMKARLESQAVGVAVLAVALTWAVLSSESAVHAEDNQGTEKGNPAESSDKKGHKNEKELCKDDESKTVVAIADNGSEGDTAIRLIGRPSEGEQASDKRYAKWEVYLPSFFKNTKEAREKLPDLKFSISKGKLDISITGKKLGSINLNTGDAIYCDENKTEGKQPDTRKVEK